MKSPIEYSDPESYSAENPIRAVFYGVNGSGKTTLVGTAVDAGMRTVLIDCTDAGAVTLRKKNKDLLRIIRAKSILHYIDIAADCCAKADQIDLLVPDTVTGIQALAIREVKGKTGDKRFEMNWKKWGGVGSRVIECIAETQNFPHDVVYLVQERKKSEEDNTVKMTMPALTPSIKGYLSSCVDWVGYLSLDRDKEGNIRRVLDFRLTDELEAKDRADLFPKRLVNPTYPIIRNRIITSIGGRKHNG